MLFLKEERGNNFTIFTNRVISYVRSANKLVNLPVPNTGMTARTYSKIEFEFDFALYKLGCIMSPLTINCKVFQYCFLIYIIVELYRCVTLLRGKVVYLY